MLRVVRCTVGVLVNCLSSLFLLYSLRSGVSSDQLYLMKCAVVFGLLLSTGCVLFVARMEDVVADVFGILCDIGAMAMLVLYFMGVKYWVFYIVIDVLGLWLFIADMAVAFVRKRSVDGEEPEKQPVRKPDKKPSKKSEKKAKKPEKKSKKKDKFEDEMPRLSDEDKPEGEPIKVEDGSEQVDLF